MLVAAYTMWRAKDPKAETKHHPYWQILLEGLVVGIVTGLVGVGGGFLIIPALVLLGGLPMRLAVGTSLLIIALKSSVGFYKYVHVLTEYSVNWSLIALFVVLGIAGSFAGSFLSQKLPQKVLRKLFAVVLVVLGIFILNQNLPSLLGYSVNLWTVAVTVLAMFALLIMLSKGKEGVGVKELIDLPDDALLIDVREQDEFIEGHVVRARNLPLSQLDKRLKEIPKDKQVYLICRSGNRSGQALALLRQAGYTQVQHVRGGMIAWQLAHLPVVTGSGNTAFLK
jgi:rhodanese-related sulfurtransferase